jgi:hypothetical protein
MRKTSAKKKPLGHGARSRRDVIQERKSVVEAEKRLPTSSRPHHHRYPRGTSASAGPKGKVLKVQVDMFKCKRCGVVDIPNPFTGFEVTHQVAAGRWTDERVLDESALVGNARL